MRVHSELGPGFLEAVYREALELEFLSKGIPFVKEPRFPVHYRGQLLHSSYRADFVCFGSLLVECKALKRLTTTEESQAINYLRAAALQRAILLNFGGPQLEWKRMVCTTTMRRIQLPGVDRSADGADNEKSINGLSADGADDF
jgi:GxxExxY protein